VLERQAARTSPAAFSALFGRSKRAMKERGQREGVEEKKTYSSKVLTECHAFFVRKIPI
jgi:hypothetical protein